MTKLRTLGRLALPPRRERAGGDARRDVRRLPPADRLPLPAQPADRLDQRDQRHPVDLARAVGRRLRRAARRRRSASTSSTPRLGPRPARIMSLISARVADRPLRVSLPAVFDYVDLHEGREDRLSEDPLRLAVLDLRRLRRRDHRSLSLAWPGRPCAARRPKSSIRPRRVPAYEPRQPVLALPIVAITALAFLGLPIGHAMIAGSILYLLLAGLDMGTAAEQLLNGMYTNYIILAVPLFILAAELMNIGTMTDRLLTFCNAVVGRFRGGLAQVNVLQSIIFAGMSGSAIADAAGTGKMMQMMMTSGRQVPAELRRGADRRHRRDRPDHPAVDPDGALRARLRCLDRLPLPRRRHSRPADGAARRWSSSPFQARRRNFPVEPPTPLAQAAAHHLAGLPGADDAGRAARRHLQRRHDADRSGGRRRRLCAPHLGRCSTAASASPISTARARQRPHDRLDRHADRRRAGLQLRRDGREHPAVAERPAAAAGTCRRSAS